MLLYLCDSFIRFSFEYVVLLFFKLRRCCRDKGGTQKKKKNEDRKKILKYNVFPSKQKLCSSRSMCLASTSPSRPCSPWQPPGPHGRPLRGPSLAPSLTLVMVSLTSYQWWVHVLVILRFLLYHSNSDHIVIFIALLIMILIQSFLLL